MNDFGIVLAIACLGAFLTYLGVPAAEKLDVPGSVISGALQIAAGIITALVAFDMMPPAVLEGTLLLVLLAFFVGGAAFVAVEYIAARRANSDGGVVSPRLYIGVLMDLVVDGVVIGVGASLTLQTGLLLALGPAPSTPYNLFLSSDAS